MSRKSECQQLICEILRATPEAATADAAVQTARLANKAPVKEKRQVMVHLYTYITITYYMHASSMLSRFSSVSRHFSSS